ncbi:MAG: hypothetical protein U1F11_05115 [Steroidobacteraceae bacterium]
MRRLRSDLTELCDGKLDGRLDRVTMDWDPRAALGVVMAAGGYPEGPARAMPSRASERVAALPGKVFHAGTEVARRPGRHERAECCARSGSARACAPRTGLCPSRRSAGDGVQYRRDIGQ